MLPNPLSDIPWGILGTTVMSTAISIGLVAALLNYVLSERGAKKQRDRELKGLLSLINSEVEQNRLQLRSFKASPDWIIRAPVYALSTAAWEECRVKLSGLLEDEVVFADFDKYYTNIRLINLHRLSHNVDESKRRESTLKLLELMKELTTAVKEDISRHHPKISEGTKLEAVEGREETPQDLIERWVDEGVVVVEGPMKECGRSEQEGVREIRANLDTEKEKTEMGQSESELLSRQPWWRRIFGR